MPAKSKEYIMVPRCKIHFNMKNEHFIAFYMCDSASFNTNLPFIKKTFCIFFTSNFNFRILVEKYVRFITA